MLVFMASIHTQSGGSCSWKTNNSLTQPAWNNVRTPLRSLAKEENFRFVFNFTSFFNRILVQKNWLKICIVVRADFEAGTKWFMHAWTNLRRSVDQTNDCFVLAIIFTTCTTTIVGKKLAAWHFAAAETKWIESPFQLHFLQSKGPSTPNKTTTQQSWASGLVYWIPHDYAWNSFVVFQWSTLVHQP